MNFCVGVFFHRTVSESNHSLALALATGSSTSLPLAAQPQRQALHINMASFNSKTIKLVKTKHTTKQTKIRTKPNDACPCGSKKKFKKCCRNNTPLNTPSFTTSTKTRTASKDEDKGKTSSSASSAAAAAARDLDKIATDALVEQLEENEKQRKGQTSTATYEGASRLVSMVPVALSDLQPHERQRGHPEWMLSELLINAPLSAEIFDVLGHSFNASRAVGKYTQFERSFFFCW